MNIEKYIEECYEVAREKGFYPDDSKIEDHLMGIVSELGEAYEAHRGGKFFNKCYKYPIDDIIDGFNSDKDMDIYLTAENYRKYVSGTFEDELADVFIRLFNLCGHYVDPLNYDVVQNCFNGSYGTSVKNTSYFLFVGTIHLKQLWTSLKQDLVPAGSIGEILSKLNKYCIHHNIPIEKHIQAKHEFNKTREHLHGKEY